MVTDAGQFIGQHGGKCTFRFQRLREALIAVENVVVWMRFRMRISKAGSKTSLRTLANSGAVSRCTQLLDGTLPSLLATLISGTLGP